jgi:drug/metabolite transporter (DMT)-like permease
MNNPTKTSFYTSLGLVSVLCWSATVILSRAVTTALGKYTAGATIYLIAGVVACLIVVFRPKGFQRLFSLPIKYYVICGSLFTSYTVLLYVAIGMATSNHATVIVGLINYLWPSFIFIFSIPILGGKANWMLLPGVLFASIGVYLAAMAENSVIAIDLFSWQQTNLIPYFAALGAAISWGLYSNYCQILIDKENGDAIPIFILITGLALFIMRLFVTEKSEWSPTVFWLVMVNVAFPVIIAYSFWDLSIRKGNANIVVAASYFTPVFSTILTCVFLGVPISNMIWAGCICVTIGAVLCKISFDKK